MSQRETLRIFETEDEIYDRVMSAVDRAMDVHEKNNPPKAEMPTTDFEAWWHLEGSTPPLPGEDGEEHCKRMCEIAWRNGAYKAKGWSEPLDRLLDEAKVLADDRPVEVGNLPEWTLDAEHMLRRLVKVLNATPQPNGPKGYAGITIWGGDAAVTKVFTEEEMKYAIDTRALINYSVQQCLDALAAHDTKEQS